jgi:hypothetical protein
VALDEGEQAHGEFFWDDGDSIDTTEQGQYFFATMTFSSQDEVRVIAEKHFSIVYSYWDNHSENFDFSENYTSIIFAYIISH